MTDPPDHPELRGMLTPEFTMRRLAGLQSDIERVVDDSLDDMEADGPVVDLVQEFGFQVPFRVICDLLGMPESGPRRGSTQSARPGSTWRERRAPAPSAPPPSTRHVPHRPGWRAPARRTPATG